uniref:Cell division cycle-associated 7-like protein n=1 Tax=Cajanus cajan TaxID=3821 RepID=A0A151S159_CAJCA|nr:Cell division cycle-associated 7-like protein [Cajanus cajan]
MLLYDFPLAIIGMALRYAKLKPMKSDVSRYRYQNEQHLDDALKRIFQYGQCRQKKRDFAATCKNLKKGKPCTIKFCHSCLLNWYGENDEEVGQLGDWICIKCRNLCNCSVCRKKAGKKPTGQLIYKARELGFKCVSELLTVMPSEAFDSNGDIDVAALPSKEANIEKELVVLHSREYGMENSLDGNNYLKLDPSNAQKTSSPKISKKTKSKDLKEISNGNNVDGASKKKSLKRPKICKQVPSEVLKGNTNDDTKVCGNTIVISDDASAVLQAKITSFQTVEIEKIEEEIPLPSGVELTKILDIEFRPEDVGNALQFLEFCKVFGKALDLKEREGEAILQELVCKQNLRQGQNTTTLVVQFQIRVLTLILIDSGNESPSLTTGNGSNSWLKPLEDLITKSNLVLKDFPLDWLQEGISGYYHLDLSKKLILLNFLCDEALGTEKLRRYIEDQNSMHAKQVKETKSKVAVAKEKEKSLKQKLQNERDKVVTSNVAPLLMEDIDALTNIQSEVVQAHAEMLELKRTIPKEKHNSDAMRTKPEFLDNNGHAFWKLKSYNAHDVLLQDIKIMDETATSPNEKWVVYGPEKKVDVDKYISSR